MDLARARARYLAAIALALPAAVVACKDGATPQNVPLDDGGHATTQATPSATTTTTPTTSTGPTASVTAPPSVTPPLPPIGMRMPTCPTGTFCTSEPASTDAGAPAPYVKCGSTATHPDDARAEGWAWTEIALDGVCAALNGALEEAEKTMEAELEKVSGGLKVPGMF